MAKILEATYGLDANPDRKRTRLFREEETDRDKQVTGALYIKKKALAKIKAEGAQRVKITIEVIDG